ncbi:unnamed protein product [Knipowitschia caucasica]|uniref:LYRIC n=1 Tax=Knipowitschia caucasica TaxID=637954 RepID=A0AAV2MB52_KNICA
MEQLQNVASQQAKLITTRVTELLSRGQSWLLTEFGVDLGLNPELIPPWMILLAACTGFLLMLALWASLCRAAFKKQPVIKAGEDSVVEHKRASKVVREEPKKKKKKSKSQPNGRAAVEPQEEEPVGQEEVVPHQQQPEPPVAVKTEKTVEGKKSKKKSKQATKDPAKNVTTESKEPEEGTWETKVSNKEKREQRKKDKGSDGSSSPGGGDSRVFTAIEQPKTSAAAPPASQKKKKGGDVKLEKVESDVAKALVKTEPAPVPAAAVTKIPPQTVAPKTVNWSTNPEPASLWGSEIDGSWTVIDKSSLGTFTGLGVPSEPKSVRKLPWLDQPAVDDEWSGINGGGNDCNSDWNAPSEVWGNYEEPAPEPAVLEEPPVPEPNKNELLIEAANDDNEEDKADSNGAAKSKKKKKKKKKTTEEEAPGQNEEQEKDLPVSSVKQPQEVPVVKPAATETKVERTMKENIVQKPAITQVPQKPTDVDLVAKSNLASTQQKKPEEIQAPKPAKKKKARRET